MMRLNQYLPNSAAIAKYLTTQNQMIILVVLFIMFTGNHALFTRLLEVYLLTWSNLPFLISLTAFFTIATAIFFLLICYGRFTRWVLAVFLIAASQAGYYMDQFGVIIDVVMIDNIRQTNPQEFSGLFSAGLLIRTIIFGVIPAWLAIKYTPKAKGFLTELKSRLILLASLVVALAIVVLPFTAGYASFIREHKTTRMYANPAFMAASMVKYLDEQYKSNIVVKLKPTAEDTNMIGALHSHPELVIMVVGETARADRFSLNGYARETNPELAKQNIVSLSNVSSCGTSTGISVPCMFSVLTRKEFDREKALHIENALDVLFEHGVQVLWRDNNSDSKGVATRMKYENFKSPTLNPVCDSGECRDIGMLNGLDQYVEARKDKDILIVLHQMGNHGPEYYRRYPKEFERFKPACKTGELRNCSQEEIDNAYDNAILYTDYFLSNVIEFLKKHDNDFSTGMIYVSDHGESLGEYGIYLHAAPYIIAPKEQTHVPAIIWLGKHSDYTIAQLKPYKDYPLSHDDLFCTLLVVFELESKTCARKEALLMENADIKNQPH